MKKINKLSIILLFAILLVRQVTTISAADAPIIQVNVEDIHLTAGEENGIKIILKNTGDYKIFDVEAFISSSVPGITVLSEYHKVFNEIAADKSKSYGPNLYIDENLSLGAYTLSLSIVYSRSGPSVQSTINLPIGIVVDESYVPKIQYIPTQASIKVKSGEENKVEFGFTNEWDQTITNAEFTVDSSISSMTIIDNINTIVEVFSPGDSITLEPVISITDGTPLGTYTVSATVSYRDLNGSRYHQTFLLPLNLDSASAFRNAVITIESMEVVQENIRPGDIFTIHLTVKCSGADSYNLLSSLSFGAMSSISPITPTTVSLGDLEAGNMVTTSYKLLASGDISAGQYPVTMNLMYIDSKGLGDSLTETFTILVDGLIDFDLLDIPIEKMPVGDISELEADLLLIGTESVQFVAIGIIEDGVIERVSGSDEYIGAVDPDSPIPFDVKFKVSDGASDGAHELKLNVQYRDHLNKEHEEQLSLDVEIGERELEIIGSERRVIPGYSIETIALGITLVILFLYLNQRKNN